MSLTGLLLTERVHRDRPNLPFGWGAGTALLVGIVLTIGGVLIILWGMVGFFSGTIGNATSGNFDIGSFFSGFIGAIMLFVIGGMLAGIGGWLMRLWWLFLLVDTVADTRAGRAAARQAAAPEIRIRCQNCGGLNPETARFCMSCARPMITGPAR